MNVVKYFTNCIAVFQGGGCKAIAYIGAYEKAYLEGVFFSELAGTSAGAVIAALIAAGASPDFLKNIVKEVDFKEFKRPCGKSGLMTKIGAIYLIWKAKRKREGIGIKDIPRIWKGCKPYSLEALNNYLGFYDSDVVKEKMEEWLLKLTRKNDVTFKDLAPNLHIVATDVINKRVTEWNKIDTPDMSVAKAVQASCSIPVYFTPTDRKWVDGGLMCNCPDFIFGDDPNYYQMLTFRLRSEDEGKIKFDGFVDYGKHLATTIVEGADNLQHTFVSSPNEIEIKTSIVSATDFDKMSADVIDRLILEGAKAMDSFLSQKEAEFAEKQQKGIDNFWPRVLLKHREQMYSMISYWGYVKYDEVFVCCEDTSWAWSIFPTLLGWVNDGAKIAVYIQKNANVDEKEMSRRRMLKAMGCLLIMEDNMPFTGFFFLNQYGGRGVVCKGSGNDFNAKVYSDELDGLVIHGWIEQLKSRVKMEELETVKISIRQIPENEIVDRLKKDSIYHHANMHFEKVPLDQLLFLNSTIRSLKYKHIFRMFDIYRDNGLEPFSPAALEFKDGRLSYIGPPVVEKHNGKLYVIEGNTRCLYAYKHGQKELMMLVVEDVRAKVPVGDINDSYSIDKVIITEREIKAKDRYKGFNYNLFRHIEESLRPYESYMKL